MAASVALASLLRSGRPRLVSASALQCHRWRFLASSVVVASDKNKDQQVVARDAAAGKNSALSNNLTFAHKAKENVKTASYGAVIVAGVGVTGVVLYTVFNELFSGSSPNSIFQAASDKCVKDERVQDLLGEPISAFGEETRRGRRRHVAYLDYVDDSGKKGVRVQFYLQGRRKRAQCQVDARQDENGKMKTRFIIVKADDLLGTSVVVEDNR